jgi:hypothetical protein
LSLKTAASGRLEILITTYTTYKQNQEKINMIEWDVVVADECHIIKERKSDVTEKMALVNARVRIGLTGTAIQNNYEVRTCCYVSPISVSSCTMAVCVLWTFGETLTVGIVDFAGLDESWWSRQSNGVEE